MSTETGLDWMLTDIMAVPAVRHAIVLSADGLRIGQSGEIDRGDAERLAATCSGLQSLGRAVSAQFGRTGAAAQQIMVEFDGGYLFLVAAGLGAHLAVVADTEVDAGLVAHQMQVLVNRIGRHLSSPPRQDVR